MFDQANLRRVTIAVSTIALVIALAIFADHANLQQEARARSQQTTAASSQANRTDGAVGQPDVISIVSCASAGCHGKVGRESEEAWKTSYMVWASRDPHADAYRTLWNEQSTEILRRLFLGELGRQERAFDRAAQQQLIHDRCISCHSTVARQDPLQNVLSSDGVNCQSCHGSAQHWLDAHLAKNWEESSPQQKAALGFVELKDLNRRTQTCVGCHVGNADQDMNHDLIAAGHPRLIFDFALYMERLPKHWAGRDDPQALWNVGQFETTKSAVQLLKMRAEHWVNRQPNSVWPEFAEYDCLNCHHEMASEWFQETNESGQSLGGLTWGSWYVPYHVWPSTANSAELESALNLLRSEMTRRQPQPEKIVDLCNQVEACLTPADLWATIEQMPRWDWDALTHWYFAARACIRALEDREQPQDLGELKRLLIMLGTHLNLPFNEAAVNFERKSLEELIIAIQNEIASKAAK